jgi:uroporphyrinogen decarboxylase
MKIILDVLCKKEVLSTPIWIMRQAGRYLPEYREVRKKAGSFLNLCYNPELASEVTIQPIKRFDLDAAIIFSDILIVPHILGLNVDFLEGEGPKLENIDTYDDLKKLKIKSKEESEKIQKICDALSLTKSNLPKNKALIGFSGSPWTVATYILSKKKHDFDYCREFLYKNNLLFRDLISIITDQTIIYLKEQIKSGADIIQLFDSWSGVLPENEFYDYVIKPTKKIVDSLKLFSPNTPIIGFPKGSGILYQDYSSNVNVDCLGLDQNIPLSFAKNLQKQKIIQGNLDPVVMLCSKDIIKDKVDIIMDSLSGKGFIFNLGHGIIKETPIENVEFLVDYVKNWKK